MEEFLHDRPLWRFKKLNFTANQIHDEALAFDSLGRVEEESEDKKITKLDQLKSLASTCLNQNLVQIDLGAFEENKKVQQIFLIHLDHFARNSVLTLTETQSEKLRKKINLKEAAEASKRYDRTVELLYSEWSEAQESFDEKMKAKELKIEELKAEMEVLAAAGDKTVEKVIIDGNKLAKNARLLLIEAQDLPEVVKSIEAENEKSQRVSLLEVQKLKEQKVKVEQVLEAILSKFDQDVGAKAEDLRKLQKSVDDQRKSFEIWKETFVADQIVMHEKLMKEKQDEENDEQKECIERLSCNQNRKSMMRKKSNLQRK